ncbi:hypothetical protein RND81_12G007300 [Saponaria officinalis]|uniref:Rho termination factor N-terminal domain-containing protein n=1 Tax=Saponaria officinalis TaxID=3572 RepID=A0AAW1H1W5_SAPOF
MDFDPRITSDGKGYGAEQGVHCNFHYGHVHDVFAEDHKNEEACVQALRRLIAKADADIADLEDELAILRCQRKWAESDELRNSFDVEVCCATFKQKIDSLTSAIFKLRIGVDTSDIPRPAERIRDIIDALISSNFTESNQQLLQEGDLYNQMKLILSSDSLNLDTDEKQEADTLELSVESEKQSPPFERLVKFTQTVSEESFSDAAKYSTKDLTEVISTDPSIVELFENIESAEHASEEKRGLFTSIETIDSQSPLQASNDEGNSKPTALQRGETESCMRGSKTGESVSLMSAEKKEAMTKAEHDGHDTNIQHDSVHSLSRLQNYEAKDPVEVVDLEEALEAQALCVSDPEITYSRKKPGLKPLVQMKNLDTVGSFSPSTMLKPKKTITKRKSSLIEENLGQSGLPSSGIKRGLGFHSETNRRTKLPGLHFGTNRQTEPGTEGNTNTAIRNNSFEISQAKKSQPKLQVPEGSRVAPGRVAPNSPSRNIARLQLLNRVASGRVAPNSPIRNIECLKLLNPEEVKDSAVTALADTVTPGSSRSTVKKPKSEKPSVDLESVKRRISEDPNFLTTTTVTHLREIAKLCSLRGYSKATKTTLIELLSERLAAP